MKASRVRDPISWHLKGSRTSFPLPTPLSSPRGAHTIQIQAGNQLWHGLSVYKQKWWLNGEEKGPSRHRRIEIVNQIPQRKGKWESCLPCVGAGFLLMIIVFRDSVECMYWLKALILYLPSWIPSVESYSLAQASQATSLVGRSDRPMQITVETRVTRQQV